MKIQRSCKKGSDSHTEAYCVIPYIDPKFLKHKQRLTEKYDIYSLVVISWELTSRKSPFDL